jgi:sarcosine oxidase, subunit gamma
VPDGDRLTLADTPIPVAWNVRGDPAYPAFLSAAQAVLGLALPTQPNTSIRRDATTLLWLGPRSWLCTAQSASLDFDVARRALNDAGGALFDVSSSYVAWTIQGEASARVLNEGCPLDLHPNVFVPGQCAQSVFGHVNALIVRPDARVAYVVIVARSFAVDAWAHLRAAAAAEGYEEAAARR